MNLIDLLILVIILISILVGWYRGFISTAISLVGYFGSLYFAQNFYVIFVNIFYGNATLMNSLLHYTEGSIVISDVELAHQAVTEIPLETVRAAIAEVNVPYPFSDIVMRNIENRSFAGTELATITDYINQTMIDFTLYMLCLVLTFFVAYLVFSLINEMVGYVARYPALKVGDGVTGGVLGFVRGVFFAFFVYAFLPIVLAILPVDFLQETVATSRFAPYFYYQNILFDIVNSML